MREWHALYERHRDMRKRSGDLQSLLRKQLIELAERGHCAATIRGRLRWRHRGALQELYIECDGDREPLRALPDLESAHLTLLALVSRRTEHVHQFTATIEAVTATGSPWVAAVHLEDDHQPPDHDRKGDGACGHAAFHCHVGPSMNHDPKVRVPFPDVGPAGALDWLLSIVIPAWEPAPWARIVDSSLAVASSSEPRTTR